INSPARDAFWEVSQNLGSIPAHLQRARLNKQSVSLAQQQQQLTEREIVYQVRLAWQQWLYLRRVREGSNNNYLFTKTSKVGRRFNTKRARPACWKKLLLKATFMS